MNWIELLSTISGFLLGGGLVGLVTIGSKKKVATTDLTDQIMKKYQESVLESMRMIEEERAKHTTDETQRVLDSIRSLRKDITSITEEVACISEYLNGGYAEFRNKKTKTK